MGGSVGWPVVESLLTHEKNGIATPPPSPPPSPVNGGGNGGDVGVGGRCPVVETTHCARAYVRQATGSGGGGVKARQVLATRNPRQKNSILISRRSEEGPHCANEDRCEPRYSPRGSTHQSHAPYFAIPHPTPNCSILALFPFPSFTSRASRTPRTRKKSTFINLPRDICAHNFRDPAIKLQAQTLRTHTYPTHRACSHGYTAISSQQQKSNTVREREVRAKAEALFAV
ncbi:hypothetical protein CBL_05870 [Carabus blaptoides fortunei]